MTKTLKLSLAAGLVAVGLAAGSALVMAQDGQMPRRGPGPGGGGPMAGMRGPGGPGGPMGIGGPGLRGLDLSDDQKAQIKSIAESHQAEFKAVGEKMRAARDGMQALIEADTLDEAAVRAKSVDVAAAEADAAILNARVRAQTMQILTAEQLAKLKAQRAEREAQPRRQRGPGQR